MLIELWLLRLLELSLELLLGLLEDDTDAELLLEDETLEVEVDCELLEEETEEGEEEEGEDAEDHELLDTDDCE